MAQVGTLAQSESIGIGIRVLANGAWGFASTDRLTREGVAACAAQAVSIAKASALAKRGDVEMVPEEAYIDTWQNPVSQRSVRDSARTAARLCCSPRTREMRRVKGVTLTETAMQFRKIDAGSPPASARAFISAKCTPARHRRHLFQGDEIQKRSYPNSFGGQHALAGLRTGRIARSGRQRAARRRRSRGAAFRRAMPGENRHAAFSDGTQLGLQIHESVGHPIELDRVLGQEANFAGTSFLTLDKLEQAALRLGHRQRGRRRAPRARPRPRHLRLRRRRRSRAVHRHHQGRPVPRLSFESRNRPAHRPEPLLRHHAHRKLESPADHSHDQHQPLPGTWNFDDLIADTDDAILMETNRSWSIDDRRYHFQFSTEIGWEIKGGKKVRMLKNPSYSGITTEFWNSCDAICSRDHWTLWGTPNCGKGQPMQTMGTGHGASPARFRNVQHRHRRFSRPMSTRRKIASNSSGSRSKHRVSGRTLLPNASCAEPSTPCCVSAKSADADETEVQIDEIADALTRFANNAIHQNVAEHGLTRFHPHRRRRPHRARHHQSHRRRFLRAAVESSLCSWRTASRKIPACCPCPASSNTATSIASPRKPPPPLPKIAPAPSRTSCDLAIQNGQIAAGIFSTGQSQSALGNSRGLFAASSPDARRIFHHHAGTIPPQLGQGQFRQTFATSIRRNLPRAPAKKRTWRKDAQRTRARHATPSSSNPPPCSIWSVFFFTILPPRRWPTSAPAFNKRMGKQLFGKNITITDDAYHPLQLGAPFDGEGIPRQECLLVDRGVPSNLVYSARTAKKCRQEAHRPRFRAAQ